MDRRIKYNLDYTFFERNSPELWYFIGFVYADGNLRGNELSIVLAIKDKDFLKDLVERFSDVFIRVLKKERKGKIKSYVRWMISRVKLASILRDKFDLIERKTHIMKFPRVPYEYLRDFIRGYFDGDGCFFIRKKSGSEHLLFNIACGSKDFMDRLCSILQGWGCRISFYKLKDKETWYIGSNKQSTQQFVKSIYYEGCLCMKRKADLYYDKYGIRIM